MPSYIFNSLLKEKVKSFLDAFESTSHQVFYDEKEKRLRHSGEFGTYRELLVREFLRFFTPGRLDIHNGFVVTATNEVSTQCDIVIYDSKNTPLIETGERQRFFPVECACSVGEIKSTLSKSELKAALIKMGKIKQLREQIPAPTIVRREREGKFDPLNYAYDQLPTFLVCQKLDFDFRSLPDELNEMYGEDVEVRHRHNLILSLEDGLITYVDSNGKSIMFPEISGRNTTAGLSPHEICRNRLITPNESSFAHIQLFCSWMFLLSSSATVLYPDISSYMDLESCDHLDQKMPNKAIKFSPCDRRTLVPRTVYGRR